MIVTRVNPDGSKEQVGVNKVGVTRDGRWIVRGSEGYGKPEQTFILSETDTRRAKRDERKEANGS